MKKLLLFCTLAAVFAGWQRFTFKDDRKWNHIFVRPELRLWTRETFDGHFFGLHAYYAF